MFNKEKSTILKGVAILMMMWHHCFLEGRFEAHDVNFFPLSDYQATNIAMACKICVSLFAFVSGYGLFLSYRRFSKGENGEKPSSGRWIWDRLCRTLSGYWLIVVICWLVCGIIDGRPWAIYGFNSSALTGVSNMLMDFTGLAHLFETPKLIETWWYMSAAIIFIILVPLLYKSIGALGSFFTAGMVVLLPRLLLDFPGGVSPVGFLLVFCFGMIFASEQLFEKWDSFWKRATKGRPVVHIIKFLLMSGSLVLYYKLYIHLPFRKFWEMKWAVLPLFVIFFVNDYIANVPVLKKILEFLGKHSMNVFLIHSFIRAVYCEKLVYGMPHSVLTVLLLLGLSLVISVVIEQFKRLIRYDKLTNRLAAGFKKQDGGA